jgi:adenylate kinase
MIPGARLIILGRQGAGKGTQCVRLARHYVVPHISTGDMLRAAVKEGTPFGVKAKASMDAGELMADDVMIGIVDDRLNRDDTRTRGYILDGFPRTVPQAIALIDITTEQRRPVDLVLNLDVPRELVVQRISSRRVCSDCGANYSLTNRPRRDWVCDFCGGDVVQRDDDTTEAIQRRLDLYDTQTAPLIDFYERLGDLCVVDGVGDPDEVTHRLIVAIDHARASRRRG